jgi:hypothetical protein
VPYLRFGKDGHRGPMVPCIHPGMRELMCRGQKGVTFSQRGLRSRQGEEDLSDGHCPVGSIQGA